ncbi:hypothetical protein AGMMS49944_01960 [Spirochaetia bacterium]|nr:hypothetical protein AGMMS49944_01960 [Spirochaetia bacterium]
MSNAELLFKEIAGLPDHYMGEILDFVGYLKHKAPPAVKAFKENGAFTTITHEDFAKNLAEIRQLCKDSSIIVDSFLEERHAETEREEAKYRRMFHHESEK